MANHTDAASGTDGKVAFYNGSDGPIDLLVDWYGIDVPTTYSGSYQPLAPLRILDTRTTLGGLHGRVPGHGSITLTVGGVHGVPADAEAVLLNVTAVSPSSSGYLTVYPYSFGLPTTSESTGPAGKRHRSSSCPRSTMARSFYTTAVAVRWTSLPTRSATTTGRPEFVSISPPRRLGCSTPATAPEPAARPPRSRPPTFKLDVAAAPGLSHEPTTAIELNITATGANGSGYLTVYPDGSPRRCPPASTTAAADPRPTSRSCPSGPTSDLHLQRRHDTGRRRRRPHRQLFQIPAALGLGRRHRKPCRRRTRYLSASCGAAYTRLDWATRTRRGDQGRLP